MTPDPAAFDWSLARAFLATVRAGSLSGAARALRTTQPTVGRQIDSLERRLGVPLFERGPRGLILTPAGRDLRPHAEAMAEAATALSLTAAGQVQSIEGLVRISASEGYAAHVVPELLRPLRDRHPGLRLEIVATNELSDLRRREADVAIRNAEPTDADLIARRMADDGATLFATPDFLRRIGPIRALSDLTGPWFVGFGDDARFVAEAAKMGLPLTEASIAAGSANHLVHWQLMREGFGIGIGPVRLGDADPAVVRVLPNLAPWTFPVWLVAPRELRSSARLRLVFDTLAAGLGARPLALDGPDGKS